MKDLEILKNAIELLSEIYELTIADRKRSSEPNTSLPSEAQTKLIQYQKISIRVEKILEHLDITTVVQQYGKNFDVIKQSATDGDPMMIQYALPLIRQAEGFLSDPGNLGESFKLNPGIDEDVHYRFMTGDYGGAVAKAFKVFKSKLHKHAGTDDIDTAIGELKKKWGTKKQVSDKTRENFEKGITHLLSSLARFRNVEFHSEDWSVEEKQEAFYFISMISMCLDILDKYID